MLLLEVLKQHVGYRSVVGGLQELAAQKFDDFVEVKNQPVSNPLAKS